MTRSAEYWGLRVELARRQQAAHEDLAESIHDRPLTPGDDLLSALNSSQSEAHFLIARGWQRYAEGAEDRFRCAADAEMRQDGAA